MDYPKRKFKLVNYLGEERELLGFFNQLLPFFHQPDGLGQSFSLDTRKAQNGKIITNVENDYLDIKGELVFRYYEDYDNFIDWLNKSQQHSKVENNPKNNLKLYYETNYTWGEWYFEVFCKDINKSEKQTDDALLHCDTTFERLSNLKRDVILEVDNSTENENKTTWPLPSSRHRGYNDTKWLKWYKGYTNIVEFSITNDLGYVDLIPCILKIEGGFTNPYFKNYTNGYEGKFKTEESNAILISDANPEPKILLNNVNSPEIMYPYYECILFLSPGKNNIKVTLNDVVTTNLPATVTITFSQERYS